MTARVAPHKSTFLILFFWMVALHYSHGQISKKTYQTIITDNAETVKINIQDADVELKETKGTRILIETSIQLSVANEALLNFVIENGRYELVQTVDAAARELVIASKTDKNVIVVKGETCKEHITYTIYIPTNMKSFKL